MPGIEIDARKEKIDESGAWQLMKDAAQILVASRGKYQQWVPDPESRQELMTKVMGRSGNLRAPALRVGDVWLIGFNEEMYRLNL